MTGLMSPRRFGSVEAGDASTERSLPPLKVAVWCARWEMGQAAATFKWHRFFALTTGPFLRAEKHGRDIHAYLAGVISSCVAGAAAWEAAAPLSLRAQRGALSYVAFVSGDPIVQLGVLQVLATNGQVVARAVAEEFRERCPGGVMFLFRRERS